MENRSDPGPAANRAAAVPPDDCESVAGRTTWPWIPHAVSKNRAPARRARGENRSNILCNSGPSAFRGKGETFASQASASTSARRSVRRRLCSGAHVQNKISSATTFTHRIRVKQSAATFQPQLPPRVGIRVSSASVLNLNISTRTRTTSPIRPTTSKVLRRGADQEP